MDEDKNIRDLFAGFNPPLPSSPGSFISRLERNMEVVEAARRHTVAMRRRNRLAVIAGAAAGFAAGLVCSRLMPLLSGLITPLDLSGVNIPLPEWADMTAMASWCLTAVACGLTALATYEAVMSGLKPTEANP